MTNNNDCVDEDEYEEPEFGIDVEMVIVSAPDSEQEHEHEMRHETDAEMASRLQALECQRVQDMPADTVPRDPVWGEHERGLSPTGVLLFTFFPCFVAKKEAWFRAFKCPTFWMIIAECVLLVYSLVVYGFDEDNPMMGPSADALLSMGASGPGVRHEVWRLFTPMFLHAGIIHFVLNAFIQFRIIMWRDVNCSWITACYFILFTGTCGTLCSGLLLPNAVSVGASGVIMGYFGSWLVELFLKWERTNHKAIELICIFSTVLMVFSMSALPHVDWATHLGGFIAGMLFAIAYFNKSFLLLVLMMGGWGYLVYMYLISD